jgi:hypothetical protein
MCSSPGVCLPGTVLSNARRLYLQQYILILADTGVRVAEISGPVFRVKVGPQFEFGKKSPAVRPGLLRFMPISQQNTQAA